MTKSDNNRGTKFCFTDFGLLNWEKIFNENDELRFVGWGEEICPKTKKKHLQGFLQMKKTCRFAHIKKMCKYPGLHLEVMKGRFDQNEKYCSKEGVYKTLGEFVTQGHRSDLDPVIEDIVNTGGDVEHIMEMHPETYMKFHGGIDKLCTFHKKKKLQKWMDVETHILCGEAGTGKTTYVTNKYGYENVFVLDTDADSKFLLDGYAGEEILLIDDFNGGIKYNTMLRLLDGHPMKLNVKNGRAYKAWKHVYITSNVSPAMWYRNRLGDNLVRRLTDWHKVDKGVILKPLSLKNIKDIRERYDSYGDSEDDIGDVVVSD